VRRGAALELVVFAVIGVLEELASRQPDEGLRDLPIYDEMRRLQKTLQKGRE